MNRSAILLACVLSLTLMGCTSDPLAPRQTHTLTRSIDHSSPSSLMQSRYRASGEYHKDTYTPDTITDLPSTPDEFIRLALYRSPELERAYQRWVAMGERVTQAGVLPDPRLSMGFFANEVETRVGAQQARIGLTQQLPWTGRRRAAQDAASAEARAAWIRYIAIERSITRRVITTLYTLNELDGSVEITRESLSLLASFEESIRARYRVGTSSHPDLIRVQVELGILNDQLISLETSRAALVAQLNALLDRSYDAPVAPISNLPIPTLDATLEELIARASDTNPELIVLSERIRAEQSRTEIARYASKPELGIGVETILTNDAINPNTSESGDDALIFSFNLNLPIWRDKYDAQVRESIANRLAIVHEHDALRNDLSARIARAHFDYTDAQRRVALFEHTLIPKATESIQSTLASFRTGTGALTDLLDAQRTLLEFERSTLRAQSAQGIALAQIHELMGITDASTNQNDSETTITETHR
jgi:outer membrane protein TolC